MLETFQFVSLEKSNKNDRIILKDNNLNAFRNSRKTILFSMIWQDQKKGKMHYVFDRS